MGIKTLTKWITSKSNITVVVLHPKRIRGKRIPIDIMGMMYTYRYNPRKRAYAKIDPFTQTVDEAAIDEAWLQVVVQKLVKWVINFGIIPVFVYDGPARPLKVEMELKRRKKASASRTKEIQELRNKHKDTRSIAIPAVDRDKLRTLLAGHNLVPRESYQRFKTFFEALGIPSVTVDGDAERFCALYSAEHSVPTYSKDSDCYAHGAHSVIIEETDYLEPGSRYPVPTFAVIRTSNILASLGIDYKSFVDLCIFAGTDYNDNIRGQSLGKGIPLIQEYGQLENFPTKKFNVNDLNYVEVRKEFEQVESSTLIIDGSLDAIFDLDTATAALEEVGLEVWLEEVIEMSKLMG
jgi:5'-3' exonuclease